MEQRKNPHVLLLKAGNAAQAVQRLHGDYDRWFVRALSGRARLTVVQAHLNERLPDPRRFDAVMMTGSPQSVTALTPWMRRAAAFLREGLERGAPTLGVCFGHQLLGHAYGARVIRHPRGREVGTVQVRLHPAGRADPLFDGLPERFLVQATHEDVVVDEPEPIQRLAANAHSTNQAMAIGRHGRGVQFHPEATSATLGAVIAARAQALAAKSLRDLCAGLQPTPAGDRILQNFLKFFV